MKTKQGIWLDRRDGVATVTLVNVAARNALTMAMWQELAEVVQEADQDDQVRAIVLRGAGDHFSAGADIHDLPDDPAIFDRAHVAAETAISRARTPTIAAIRGACIGGGCEIAVACDVRFGERSATFGITASRLGIVYPAPPLWRLVSVVGEAAARRMLLGGEIFDVDWALRVGLIDEVVPDADHHAREFARLLCSRSAESITGVLTVFAGLPSRCEGADYREGVAAFRERRTTDFGRRKVLR